MQSEFNGSERGESDGVACSMMVVNVSAIYAHYIPGSDDTICTIMATKIVHTKHIGLATIGQHELEDGTMCYIEGLTMKHEVRCSKCGYVFSEYNKMCTINHSACGEYYKNCFRE